MTKHLYSFGRIVGTSFSRYFVKCYFVKCYFVKCYFVKPTIYKNELNNNHYEK